MVNKAYVGRGHANADRVVSPDARRLRRDMTQDFSWLRSSPKRTPLLEHVRDLWMLRGITSNVTAAIWRNDFGLELRVEWRFLRVGSR
jgi:hypothetical protein